MCMYVLVCSDCCNKTPQTEWLINYTNVFLTVLEVGRLRPGGQHGQVRTLFQVTDFSSYPHMGRGQASSLRPLS